LGVLGLLLLSLPIIASLQFYAGYPVRLATAYLSAVLIRTTGIPVWPEGTTLLWLGEIVSVDAPCSGVKMLWSGLYFNFTLACFGALSTKRTWMSYVASTMIIFVGNVLRSTVLFYGESGIIDYPAWAHQVVGITVFFFVAAGILWLHQLIGVHSRCV
jgi:exosortase/archaeosortase family protein